MSKVKSSQGLPWDSARFEVDFSPWSMLWSHPLCGTLGSVSLVLPARKLGSCCRLFLFAFSGYSLASGSIDCPSLPWPPHLSLPGRMLLGSLGLRCGLPGVQWHWVAGEAPRKATHACPVAADCMWPFLLFTSHFPSWGHQASVTVSQM